MRRGDREKDPTREFVKRIKIEEAKAEFGAGFPDLSSYSNFLQEVENLSLQEFKERYYKEEQYLPKITYDVTKAKYFKEIMEISLRPPKDYGKYDDFALSSNQLDSFKKNGFVVTEQEDNWCRAYYKVYNNDLPVLVTADSILHAFHMSYDSVLKQIETEYCLPTLHKIIESMRGDLKTAINTYKSGPFSEAFKQVDLFLTVGLNLLQSEEFVSQPRQPKKLSIFERKKQPTKPAEKVNTLFGDDTLLDQTLAACKAEQSVEMEFFGEKRVIDFSEFKPRGHYTKSEQLSMYFRSMTWLGKVELFVAGEKSSIQQIASAVILHMLIAENETIEKEFRKMTKIIEAMVGPSNAMDFNQLGILLHSVFKMKNYSSLNSEKDLAILQEKILETGAGEKKYNNIYSSPSFALLGKKFTIDNWAHSKVITNDEPPANIIVYNGEKVERFRTSAVDVAFSVFGNNDTTPIIASRIEDKTNNKFRDGLNYHPNLVAARKTIDNLPEQAWTTSIYTAFSMKKLATQMGSWTQLRHDNILYVDQLSRFVCMCEYPDGYVEPYVEFWDAMEKLCVALSGLLNISLSQKIGKSSGPADFFMDFAKTVRVLRDISVAELGNQPMSAEQIHFIKSLVELTTIGSGGETEWTGWYPRLFYDGHQDVERADELVCDVYNDPPNPLKGDPGSVLHVATSKPRRLDNEKDVCAYVGPVYDFYEFETPAAKRLNDEEWKDQVAKNATPPPPEWTASYLVV